MTRHLIALISSINLAFGSAAYADVEFQEKGDDFSNEIVSSLRVGTTDTSPAVLILSCNPATGLNVQLATEDVMYPDEARKDQMNISTTHKFEEAPEAATTYWAMKIAKYKSSWYQGDPRAFIEESAESSQLNMRLNRTGTVYRFSLEGTAEHLRKILRRC
ncbi:hypothetical protein [Chromohalobacter canadensis]|uniref:hypothetical protein n=1 Tax=Chromohalobacter canadensis TaxID=141389 RepID=UPI00240F5681|nr:hypothetical protein [Chromohalobacter canadensis]